MTENNKATLAGSSDLLLKVKVDKEADGFNMLVTTSTMALIAVFDAVCICIIEYMDYSKEKFSVIHPGRAVG